MRVVNRKWLDEHAYFTGEPDSIGWRCKESKELILAEETGRTVWDENGPGPCSSTEGVQSVVEAYCPKHGKIPRIKYGTPIQQDELVRV